MKRLLPFTLLAVLAAGCGEEQGGYQPSPAVRLTVGEGSHTTATILVESIYCDEVFVVARTGREVPSADELISDGILAEGDTVTLTGLTPGTRYTAFGVGRKGDKVSNVEKVNFTTSAQAGTLYPYEQGRDGAPFFADITLCPGGGVPNSNRWFTIPENWDKARFAPHVSYKDEYGVSHWLFDAFLAITGTDPDRKTFCINAGGSLSADKESWSRLADYWAGPQGAFKTLDEAIEEATFDISEPPGKRYAVMMIPDPIMFERFSDKSSSTKYWGAIDGVQMDFSKTEDQVKALEWYIDLVRAMFARLECKHLELAGFYIISEELVATPQGWNYSQKRWDKILPQVSEYLDQRNEGLYWIPYLGADGTSLWKELGITYAWLQPGRYWDSGNSKPIDTSISTLNRLGMGIELEFEYSMVEDIMSISGCMGPDAQGNYAFSLSDVPALRGRFREYMDAFKQGGLYGKRRIALYSGSNAMWQLANSPKTDDIAMYRELCRFISENPLKQR